MTLFSSPSKTVEPPTSQLRPTLNMTCCSHHTNNKQRLSSPASIKWLVLAEGFLGSAFILAAPLMDSYGQQLGMHHLVAPILATLHYFLHVGGGAILFKTGLDMGKLK